MLKQAPWYEDNDDFSKSPPSTSTIAPLVGVVVIAIISAIVLRRLYGKRG